MLRDRRVRVGGVVGGLLLVIGMVVTAQPAAAIVGGQRDDVHTNVGLIRFTTEEGRFRCSGTLISPTVVLTAGHCTGDTGSSPATDVYVSFNTDLALDPLAPGISPAESAARAANYITGTAHPDPGWTGEWLGQPMFFSSHDADGNRRLLSAANFDVLIDDVMDTPEPEGPAPFLWVLAKRRA